MPANGENMMLLREWSWFKWVELVELAHDPQSVFEVLGRFPCLRIQLIPVACPLREVEESRWTESSVELTIDNFGNFVLLFVDDSDWRGRFGMTVGNLRNGMWL